MSHADHQIRALMRAARSMKGTRSHLLKYPNRALSEAALVLLREIRAELAIAIEARRAETGTGTVHESAGPKDIARQPTDIQS